MAPLIDSLNGYSIVGSPVNLAKIIDEYAIHGVEIHEVVLAIQGDELDNTLPDSVQEICKARNIKTDSLNERLLYSPSVKATALQSPASVSDLALTLMSRPYWKIKRVLDAILAMLAIILISPLAMIVAILVLIDVGYPVVFWQQRTGQLGRPLHVFKFRTIQVSTEVSDEKTADPPRISLIGHLLRKSRLDEIPQLFNILFGSMSLIGPRPLLPIDQPKSIRLRLLAKPGISGLAQVNGGNLLSPDEKDAFDELYVRRASLLVDIKILLRTAWVIVAGDRRNEIAISAAVAERNFENETDLSPEMSGATT